VSKIDAGDAGDGAVPVRSGANREAVPRFVVDGMLGRLARWLRILGFDTVYIPPLAHALAEGYGAGLHGWRGRTLLTRNTALVRRWVPANCLLIECDRWDAQVRQVIHALDLEVSWQRCLTRCVRCNDLLEEVDPAVVRGIVPDYVFAVHVRFRCCPSCRRVYWPGTHRRGMLRGMERFLGPVVS